MIPGKSRTWISAPPYSSTPGMAVSVVKEYAATSDLVLVILDKNVDFPTDGKPTSAIRASPDFVTSKPDPPALPAPGAGSSSWARRRASFLVGLSTVLDQPRSKNVPFEQAEMILCLSSAKTLGFEDKQRTSSLVLFELSASFHMEGSKIGALCVLAISASILETESVPFSPERLLLPTP